MRGVREQEVGQNPFMVMVSMVGSNQRDELAHTVDAGPDDLMMRPFSRDVFVRRMNELAARGKKFVVTSEYVGPKRAPKRTAIPPTSLRFQNPYACLALAVTATNCGAISTPLPSN